MAHSCPECGCTCYCNGDIDDCVFDFDEDVAACTCCAGEREDDDDDWGEWDDGYSYEQGVCDRG